jgi:long-chain fatty acid transport protein
MKRFIVRAGTCALGVALAALPAVPALATNGYQLIGVGQMQKSMAGAVTAAPMDTMTAITNPAGMARVGQRADFSMEAFMPKRSVDFSALGGQSDKGGSELYGVPSVGWVAKAFNRDNVYFGGGMFATSGLGVDYDQTLMMPAGASPTGNDITFSGYSAIQFWQMAPTVAWNVSDRTSLGVSLNVDYQSVTIDEKIRGILPAGSTPPGSTPDVSLDLGRPTSQLGYGFGVGVLHDVTDKVTVGAAYISKQRFPDAIFRVGDFDVQAYNGAVGAAGKYKLDLDYPQQFAAGIAVRPTDRWLVDFDVKWINWSDTHDRVHLSGPANSFNAAQNPTGSSNSTDLPFGWNNQTVYKLGVQFAATQALTLRGGYNYAKAPIDEADVLNNLIFPAIVERHLSLGFDYALGAHWGIGGTYMKAFKESLTGTNDTGSFSALLGGSPSSNSTITLEETSVGVLLYYLFGT